jgi:hypothetical protein
MRLYALFALLALPVCASDFTGVYARIDRVVLEPSSGPAERVQVWGVFSIAKTDNPRDYEQPARGYLYFKLDRNPEAARKEWRDLQQVAGKSEIVAFSVRGASMRVRKPGETPDNPDPYRTNVGVSMVRNRTDYEPVRALLDFKD